VSKDVLRRFVFDDHLPRNQFPVAHKAAGICREGRIRNEAENCEYRAHDIPPQSVNVPAAKLTSPAVFDQWSAGATRAACLDMTHALQP
jgi:hypothetical protein